jgi:hypothetical protein
VGGSSGRLSTRRSISTRVEQDKFKTLVKTAVRETREGG